MVMRKKSSKDDPQISVPKTEFLASNKGAGYRSTSPMKPRGSLPTCGRKRKASRKSGDKGQELFRINRDADTGQFYVHVGDQSLSFREDIREAFYTVLWRLRKYYGYDSKDFEGSDQKELFERQFSKQILSEPLAESSMRIKQSPSPSCSMTWKRLKPNDPVHPEALGHGSVWDSKSVTEDADGYVCVDRYPAYVPIRVGDTEGMEKHFRGLLILLKQANLKTVLKVWIRTMERRKQSDYPYNGGVTAEQSRRLHGRKFPGELSEPFWWPPLTKSLKPGVRHKEPDHLSKDERLKLAVHMLCAPFWMVSMLRQSTAGISSLQGEPAELLEELYANRREQERFQVGEIDGETTLFFRDINAQSKGKGRGRNLTDVTSKGHLSTLSESLVAEESDSSEAVTPEASAYIEEELCSVDGTYSEVPLLDFPSYDNPSKDESSVAHEPASLEDLVTDPVSSGPSQAATPPFNPLQYPTEDWSQDRSTMYQDLAQAMPPAAGMTEMALKPSYHQQENAIPNREYPAPEKRVRRRSSVLNGPSPSYSDWPATHTQHESRCDLGLRYSSIGAYQAPFTSYGYPLAQPEMPFETFQPLEVGCADVWSHPRTRGADRWVPAPDDSIIGRIGNPEGR
ncbi:MAG: hypothetical protein Q9190_002920 [Brigantiaea leucoxantha]